MTFDSVTGVIDLAPQDGDAVGFYNCAIKSTMTDYPSITTTTSFPCQVSDCVPVIYPPVLTPAQSQISQGWAAPTEYTLDIQSYINAYVIDPFCFETVTFEVIIKDGSGNEGNYREV